jgi:hypothetical protein
MMSPFVAGERILIMRWPLALVPVCALAAAGCGGGGHHATSAPSLQAPAVAQQLRVTLQTAFHPTASLATYTPPRSPIHANVRACTGPASGGAGAYRCVLTPQRGFAPKSVTVAVKPDGTWTLAVPHNPREHRRSYRAMYGGGLHMPNR